MNRGVIFLGMVLGCMLMSCSQEEKVEKVLRPVKTVVVKPVLKTSDMTFPGRTQFSKEAKVSFKVPGTIKKIYVKAGDRVKKGQLLADLDISDYSLMQEQAEASLEMAEAQYDAAKGVYTRVQALYVHNNASRNDLDQAKAAFISARSMKESAEKNVRLAEKQVKYGRLKAPEEGVIAAILAEEGENLGEFRPIVVIATEKQVEVVTLIPETMVSSVRMGDSVIISGHSKNYTGTVSETGIMAVGSGNTYPVTILLDDPDESLTSGLIMDVTFTPHKETHSYMLPSHAVQDENGRRFVYCVVKDGNKAFVRQVQVKTGDLTDNGFEVLEGLKEGDIVVTAGISELEENMEVRVPENMR